MNKMTNFNHSDLGLPDHLNLLKHYWITMGTFYCTLV